MVWRNLQLCEEGCRKDFKGLDRYRKGKVPWTSEQRRGLGSLMGV